MKAVCLILALWVHVGRSEYFIPIESYHLCKDHDACGGAFVSQGKQSRAACAQECTCKGCTIINYSDGECFLGGIGSRASHNNQGERMYKFKTVKIGKDNIALGKTAMSKSLYEGLIKDPTLNIYPQAAIDGVVNTLFHSAFQTANKEWWRVDLGQTYPVAKIRVTIRDTLKTRFRTAKLYISSGPIFDPAMDFFAEQEQDPTTDVIEYAVEGWMCGRYLTIQKGNDVNLELKEVEVFEAVLEE